MVILGKKRRPKRDQDALDRLEDFLHISEPELMALYEQLWAEQQEMIPLLSLQEAVEQGMLPGSVLHRLEQSYTVFLEEKLKLKWMEALAAGAQARTAKVALVFDPLSERVQAWIGSYGANWVTVITDKQKDAIAHLLDLAVSSSLTPDELSRVIRPCIGLHKKQAVANFNYYHHIRKTILENHPRTTGASASKQALRASYRYANKQRRARALTIATTEMSFAYNHGEHEAILQAQEQGLMGKMVKRWSTADDDTVCEICSALGAMEPVAIDEEFNFHGRLLFADQRQTAPAHPNCKCAVVYEEVSPPLF